MDLHTDTQILSYVLRSRETDTPAGLRAYLADTRRMQVPVTVHSQIKFHLLRGLYRGIFQSR